MKFISSECPCSLIRQKYTLKVQNQNEDRVILDGRQQIKAMSNNTPLIENSLSAGRGIFKKMPV
jgi:hypothetical protein